MSAGENIARQTETAYADYKKIKTLVDVGFFLENYIVSGGEVTKDIYRNDTINVSTIVVSLDNDVTQREGNSFKTKIANTTYYLDYQAGDFEFNTSHPSGSYLPIAEVTTDGNRNVLVITDKRGVIGGFRLLDNYMYPEIAALQAETSTLQGDVDTLETNKANKKTLSSFGGLSVALEMGVSSTAIQVLGDSTGNDTFEWPYLLGQYIAARYPNWRVQLLLWSDALQEYTTNYQLSNPTAGIVRVGGGSQTRYLPNAAIPHITGDLDIRVKLKMPDWTPSSTVTPIARFFATPSERSWYLSILSDGKLQFVGTKDGSTLLTATSPNPAIFQDGDIGWIRAWVDVDNEVGGWSVTFYQSSDGVNWTGLATAANTTDGPLVLNNAVGVYEIGGRTQSGEILPAGAELYEVDIRDGLNGPSVAPRMPDLWYDRMNGQSHAVLGAPTFHIVNGSHPGANLSYLGNSTRVKKMTPNYGQTVTIISDSHNEGAVIDGQFRATYATFIDDIKSRIPQVPIVATAQNPQAPTISGNIPHSIRRKNIFEVAKVKNVEVLDVYSAFLPDPTPYLSDGVHPNEAGQILWRDVVIDAIP